MSMSMSISSRKVNNRLMVTNTVVGSIGSYGVRFNWVQIGHKHFQHGVRCSGTQQREVHYPLRWCIADTKINKINTSYWFNSTRPSPPKATYWSTTYETVSSESINGTQNYLTVSSLLISASWWRLCSKIKNGIVRVIHADGNDVEKFVSNYK